DTMHIRACNALGCGPWSADIGPIPGFVTNRTIEANDAIVSLDWDPPANDDVAVVEDYTVSRSADGGTTWSELATTTDTAYEDDTQSFATSYKYRIIANGADGSGGWSALDITTEVEQVLGVSDTELDVPEGGSNTFDVTLTRPVDEATDIAVSSDSPAAAPAAPTVTVAADGTSATVTINGVDNDLDGDGSATITVAYLGQSRTVEVAVLDDDVQAIVLDETAVSVKDGNNTLVNVSLALQPASNVTVSVTSDAPGTASVSPSLLTFTPSNWATTQFVVITGADPGSTIVSFSSPGVVTQTVDVNVTGPPVP
ncbi:MAG: hypothetical protein NTX33_04430, partial [Propionibacteriales bacterium]|nr:hypothetical protein [Propionibacteriales bacterium]